MILPGSAPLFSRQPRTRVVPHCNIERCFNITIAASVAGRWGDAVQASRIRPRPRRGRGGEEERIATKLPEDLRSGFNGGLPGRLRPTRLAIWLGDLHEPRTLTYPQTWRADLATKIADFGLS